MRFLEDVRNNFFIQVLHGTAKGDTQLELPFTNKEELAGDEIISRSIGCSDHEVNCEGSAVSEKGQEQNKDSGLQVQTLAHPGSWYIAYSFATLPPSTRKAKQE